MIIQVPKNSTTIKPFLKQLVQYSHIPGNFAQTPYFQCLQFRYRCLKAILFQ